MIPYVVKGQLDSLEKDLEAKIANASSEPKSVAYDELVALARSSKLIVGKEYRITDYCTTIMEENAADPECGFGISPYKSAKHPFDIIVTAIANNKVGLKAKAAVHEGDEYFANSHLEQWEVTYELERPEDDRSLYDIPESGEYIMFTNDPWTAYPFVEERDDGPSWLPHYYVWADSWDTYITQKRNPEIGDDAFMEDDLSQETRPEEPSGGTVSMYKQEHYTGRIFFLKDEFNNCANYDFKNIMTHSRAIASDGNMDVTKCLNDRYYYLFDNGSTTESDNSVTGNTGDGYYRCSNNRICINGSTERIDPNMWYFGRIVIDCWGIAGVHIESLNGARTENIVISSNKGTSSSAENIHIGSGCSSIILNGSGSYPYLEADIGNATSNVIFEGGLNGSLRIGCGCSNITLYGRKASGSSKTTDLSSVNIGDKCQNITLGDPNIENAKISGNVVIGSRCYDVNLPGSIWDITLGSWCTDIKCDDPNSGNKYVALQFVTLGNHCTDITFKLADARGNYYNNITMCDAVRYMTFEQDNTGKGVCQDTQVKNIFVAPGFQSVCNTKDARFDPVSGSNVNNGQTYFTIDANKDTIMYWFNSGITMAGKKWDKTNKVWVAL